MIITTLRHRLASLIAAALLIVIAWACADGPRPADRAMLCDVVTLESSTREQGLTFTFRRYDDSPLITLTVADRMVDEKYVGQRMLLYYYPASGMAYTSGPIEIVSLSAIAGGQLIIDTDPATLNWDADPVWVYSMWRSGNYINLHYRLVFTADERTFALAADPTTIDSAEPTLYLVHDTGGQPDNFLREGFASFDIAEVWNRPTCRSVKIMVRDSNLGRDSFSFTKP